MQFTFLSKSSLYLTGQDSHGQLKCGSQVEDRTIVPQLTDLPVARIDPSDFKGSYHENGSRIPVQSLLSFFSWESKTDAKQAAPADMINMSCHGRRGVDQLVEHRLEIQRPEVRTPPGTQENICESFFESKMLC